jgi:GNAT superfamily N-acetyltransferase/chorismate mutase
MTDPAPDLVLRPAEVADADAVTDIHLAARREAAMPPLSHPAEEVRDWLGGRVEASDDEVWLAEVRGTPAGYARVSDHWLSDLYVVPRHHRQGVGTALLDLVKARRPDGFCLWVFEMNTPARTFYERHGLVELERTDGYGNDEKSPDIKMAWPGGDPLSFFRRLIDDVDADLGELLARRVALTRAAQTPKDAPGRDPVREAEIAAAMANRAPELGAERLRRIMDVIITESLDATGGS